MRGIRRGSWSWIAGAVLLGACGGTAQPVVNETEAEPRSPEPLAEPAEPEVAEPEEPAEAEVAEPEEPAEPEESAEPEPPPPEPVTATNADELREAMLAASTDVVAFRRLVDPAWGIGAYNREEDLVRHYCDMEELASHAGLGYLMTADDPWRCDRDLDRCTVQGDGDGYAFHFREGEGDVVWLATIVHYPRRAPNRPPRRVRDFVRSGDGVCDLWRAVQAPADEPPPKVSVFVASHTGLVPETVAEHHCGDAAASAYAERIAPLAQAGEPDRCDREPLRCVFANREEQRTVYLVEEGHYAFALTRPGMFDNLAREQQRELDAFLSEARRHDCDGD